jgi:uncharacterized protein (TIGR02391 family)
MLETFETIVRNAAQFSEEPLQEDRSGHPFDSRAIHEKLPAKVRKLFDDSHYAEATFEAYKFVDRKVSEISGLKESGYKLMMAALADAGPIKLNSLKSESEKDEQRGYQFMLAGAMSAVRNPRGHEFGQFDPAEMCLDHLSLASLFIRRLEDAGYSFS